MRDYLIDAPGRRGAAPRTLPLAASDGLRAAHWTSNVRVRHFTPGTTPPPLTHPLVLLREEGSLAPRPGAHVRDELELEGRESFREAMRRHVALEEARRAVERVPA